MLVQKMVMTGVAIKLELGSPAGRLGRIDRT